MNRLRARWLSYVSESGKVYATRGRQKDDVHRFGDELNFESVGVWVRDLILWAANMIVDEYWPGLISAALFAAMIVIVLRIAGISRSRRHVLISARKDADRASDSTGYGLDVEALRKALGRRKGNSGRALATGFSECCETLTVMGRGIPRVYIMRSGLPHFSTWMT